MKHSLPHPSSNAARSLTLSAPSPPRSSWPPGQTVAAGNPGVRLAPGSVYTDGPLGSVPDLGFRDRNRVRGGGQVQAPREVHLAAGPPASALPGSPPPDRGRARARPRAPGPRRRPRALPTPGAPAARPSIPAPRPRGIFFLFIINI